MKTEALIVRRKSGKRAPTITACRPRNHGNGLQRPLLQSDPAGLLSSGKFATRELVSNLSSAKRLDLARSFTTEVIRAYWHTLQEQFIETWPLPAFFESSTRAETMKDGPRLLARTLGETASQLDPITAGYLIGVIYTAMIPDDVRSSLGVYYTPPALTRRLLDMSTHAGIDWRTCCVLDPACGGGAFLAPVAARMLEHLSDSSPAAAVEAIGTRLRGFEIDPFSAWMSQVFLEATLMETCRRAGKRLPAVVQVRDSLLGGISAEGSFDLVIGNPPYGRVTLKTEVRKRFSRSLFGHANLYGLFTDIAVKYSREGGVIAYVTPTSFLAGEYFKSLRSLLANEAPPLNIDFVSARKGVFDDALQETLLATYRRGGQTRQASAHFISPVDFDTLSIQPCGTFDLPPLPSAPWLVPRTAAQEGLISALKEMRHRLKDYGYKVSTGPLVWNRHKGQLTSRAGKGALPLIWAEAVTSDGRFVFRATKKNHQPYFKPTVGQGWLISKKPCVLLQRTTAKEQTRRIIAAELPKGFLGEHGAVVIENHLNMIYPASGRPLVEPDVLAALLNSEIVDRTFRCISGSVAVSAYELEALPLPPPAALNRLAALLETRADRTELEKVCCSLYLQDTRHVSFASSPPSR